MAHDQDVNFGGWDLDTKLYDRLIAPEGIEPVWEPIARSTVASWPA